MKARWLLVAFAALPMLAGSAFAQPVSDDDPPIIVTAPRETARERVSAFVSSLTMPQRRFALPRWARTVCPGTVGIDATHARALNDRIAQIALDLGLEVGEPGCTPNIVAYFTFEPSRLANDYVEQRQMPSRTSQSRAVRDFVERPRTVRWWHLTSTNVDGVEIDQQDSTGVGSAHGGGEGNLGGSVSIEMVGEDRWDSLVINKGVRVREASRLRANVEENLTRVLVIVDAGQINALRYGTLVDYIAMVSLAQINPDAEIADIPTILNLFAETDAPAATGLTEWDIAYLRGLYRSPDNARDARQQESAILRTMMEDGQ